MKKKIGIALLVSLLVAASAFAASSFSGKARLRVGGWHQYGGHWVYGMQDKSDAYLVFMIQELIGSSTGEGKVFAEVEAGAQLRMKNIAAPLNSEWTNPETGEGNFGSPAKLRFRLFFNKASIVLDKEKGIRLSISGVWPQPRYAKGWEVEIDNGNTIASDPFFTYSTAYESITKTQRRATGAWIPAITFSYDKYAFSFGIQGSTAFNKNPYFAEAGLGLAALFQANGIKLGENMDLSVAAGYMQSPNMQVNVTPLDLQQHILYGLGFNYKSDTLDVSLGANGNISVNDNPWVADYVDGTFIDLMGEHDRFGTEASFNLALKGDFKLNIDAWYLDNLGLWSSDNQPEFVTFHNKADLGFVYRQADGTFLRCTDDDSGNGYDNVLHRALSARISMQPIDMLGVTVRAQDILNQGIYGVDLPIKVVDGLTLTPTFEVTLDTEKKFDAGKWTNNGEKNTIYEGCLGINYSHELFNIFATIKGGTETGATKKDGTTGTFYVKPYLSVTSTSLIDNCRLELRWQAAAFTNAAKSPSDKYHSLNGAGEIPFGDIYLEARINF